jgi:hypothetical protein
LVIDTEKFQSKYVGKSGDRHMKCRYILTQNFLFQLSCIYSKSEYLKAETNPIYNLYMKSILFTLTFISITLTACGPSDQEQAQQEQRQQQMQMQLVETTAEFNAQMASVLNRYFDLKDALVESDAVAAKGYAESLKTEAEEVVPEGLNRETSALWVSFREVIVKSSNELADQEDVDDQRYHFEYISESMIQLVDTFRPVGYDIYQQSCPMVRGGTADWLSREEGIRNPYHGDRMMRCGEVIRRI